MLKTVLEVDNLKKYFHIQKGTLHAVDGISFKLEQGKTLGVVGESGCGKSTLGRTIMHLYRPTEGAVVFQGVNLEKTKKEKLRQARLKMQMIFQDPYSSLDARMCVQDLIMEPLLINHICSKKEAEERVKKTMETVGLASRLLYAYPHELDGGRRQRIGIARAIILEPSLIICDEPVSALDVSIQAQILNLLMDFQEEKNLSYIFITHDLSVVKHISNDIMVMYMGKCIEKASADEIFKNPIHPYTKGLLSAIPIPDISMRDRVPEIMRGEVTSPINPNPGCRFAARCPFKTDACTSADPAYREVCDSHFVSCALSSTPPA